MSQKHQARLMAAISATAVLSMGGNFGKFDLSRGGEIPSHAFTKRGAKQSRRTAGNPGRKKGNR